MSSLLGTAAANMPYKTWHFLHARICRNTEAPLMEFVACHWKHQTLHAVVAHSTLVIRFFASINFFMHKIGHAQVSRQQFVDTFV